VLNNPEVFKGPGKFRKLNIIIEVNKMEKIEKKEDRSLWAIGGSSLAGLGAGFFFLQISPLAFVGCLLIGLGFGLVIVPVISALDGQK
jgi:hypothetical protein